MIISIDEPALIKLQGSIEKRTDQLRENTRSVGSVNSNSYSKLEYAKVMNELLKNGGRRLNRNIHMNPKILRNWRYIDVKSEAFFLFS